MLGERRRGLQARKPAGAGSQTPRDQLKAKQGIEGRSGGTSTAAIVEDVLFGAEYEERFAV